MEIYVVQQGDTIHAIAIRFGISVAKLISDNGINNSDSLVVGQSLVITHPEQVYMVKEGDILGNIAEVNNVTIRQLLRNNPDLANRQYIFPGETIIISYNNDKGSLWIVGYTYPFVSEDILRKTLSCLTYLLILNYRITKEGDLIGSDEDIAVIETAKLFDTASTLVLTSYSITGEVNIQLEYDVLLNPQIQDKIIDNLLSIVKEKDYNGVNLAFQYINVNNQLIYLNFLIKVSKRLHLEGYSVFLTINPRLTYNGYEVVFEKINYREFSNNSDGILFLSYDWGMIDQSPSSHFSIITTSSLLEYIISQVPIDKIRIAVPTLGYDWKLPYIPGQTRANVINYESIISLAQQKNVVIQYDERTLLAFFEYVDSENQKHIVLFKDARSIDSSLKILNSYGIYGIGIWNIMYYFPQLWSSIVSQYEIITI